MTLVWRPGFQFDTDASTYIEAVEAADTQALETNTRYAINDFVIGCKQDGIWNAIKASCILAGARTLAGALVPLVGAAPSTGAYVAGDYNRKMGLYGAGKALNTNRAGNADPQNNRHFAVLPTTLFTGPFDSTRILASGTGISGSTLLMLLSETSYGFWLGSSGTVSVANTRGPGFLGASRQSSSQFSARASNTNVLVNNTSVSMLSNTYKLWSADGAGGGITDQSIAFYSFGESLDLALLDARVTDLINAFAAAIP